MAGEDNFVDVVAVDVELVSVKYDLEVGATKLADRY